MESSRINFRKELYLETNNDLKIMISSKISTMTTFVREQKWWAHGKGARDARYAPAVSGPYIYIYLCFIYYIIYYIYKYVYKHF